MFEKGAGTGLNMTFEWPRTANAFIYVEIRYIKTGRSRANKPLPHLRRNESWRIFDDFLLRGIHEANGLGEGHCNAVNQRLKIVLFNWVVGKLSELLLALSNCVGPNPSLLGTLVPGLKTKNRGGLKKQSGYLS